MAGDGSQTRSRVLRHRPRDGILQLLHSDQPGPVNIGNPKELTVLQLAEIVQGVVGSSSPITFVPRPVDDPSVRQPDISLARSTLGWQPEVSLDEGLKHTVAWFREHPEVLT